MHAVMAAELTARGTAKILVDEYTKRRGCLAKLVSDNGEQFYSELSNAVYKLRGCRKLTTSSQHPTVNGGGERANHTMARVLATVVNENQTD